MISIRAGIAGPLFFSTEQSWNFVWFMLNQTSLTSEEWLDWMLAGLDERSRRILASHFGTKR